MGFEVVVPGVWRSVDALPAGWASIAKNGKLTLHSKDLAQIGVKDRAVVLQDRETFRIALRAPRGDQDPDARGLTTLAAGKAKRDTGRRSIDIGRAVRMLDLQVEKVRGRYELVIKGQGRDALLIVNLMPDTSGIGAPHGKGKGGGK